MSNALSVCSVIETSDGYILLDKRQSVDAYAGRYHIIGGFFERDLDSASMSSTKATTVQPDPFVAIIREETGIQSTDIHEQYCLGAVYDLTLPHCDLCFSYASTFPCKKCIADSSLLPIFQVGCVMKREMRPRLVRPPLDG